MPVILLIDNLYQNSINIDFNLLINKLKSIFSNYYNVFILNDIPFELIRSKLTNQKITDLYIVPDLPKPDRYEIYCLVKNLEQEFMTLTFNTATPSDKNVFILNENWEDKIFTNFLNSKLKQTSAHKRSKGVSLKNLNELKEKIKEIKKEFIKNNSGIEFLLENIEETIYRGIKSGIEVKIDEILLAYKKMVELKLKKINQTG